jgi:hypothetical protein
VRVVHDPGRRRCTECGERADVAVARGHRLWYCCWDHAPTVLEAGGVIVAGADRRRRR